MRMSPDQTLWEYVCVYVDDLCLTRVDGHAFLAKLKASIKDGGYGYPLKGDGPLWFHLGCDYGRDSDGTLMYKP